MPQFSDELFYHGLRDFNLRRIFTFRTTFEIHRVFSRLCKPSSTLHVLYASSTSSLEDSISFVLTPSKSTHQGGVC